ncbi:MAG: dehydrogenase, partial [Acidimicrobiia bacterium]|nr:dehydrogenase [Acidimicrobiia bacterium]
MYAAPIEPSTATTQPEPAVSGEEVNLITAINRTLHEIMAAEPTSMIFGEDVADPKGGVFKATLGLTEEFGETRSFNTPLAESLVIGIGIGMAAAG